MLLRKIFTFLTAKQNLVTLTLQVKYFATSNNLWRNPLQNNNWSLLKKIDTIAT